jgi:hypothetical protein
MQWGFFRPPSPSGKRRQTLHITPIKAITPCQVGYFCRGWPESFANARIFSILTSARVATCRGQPPLYQKPQSLTSLPGEPRLQPATLIVTKSSTHWRLKAQLYNNDQARCSIGRFWASMSPRNCAVPFCKGCGCFTLFEIPVVAERALVEGRLLRRTPSVWCGNFILKVPCLSSVQLFFALLSRLFSQIETSIYNRVSNINKSL